MSHSHKDLVREFYDAIDSGNLARVGQLCTPTAMFQFGGAPAIPVAQFTQMLGGPGGGSSRHVVRDLVAEGDKLACHVRKAIPESRSPSQGAT